MQSVGIQWMLGSSFRTYRLSRWSGVELARITRFRKNSITPTPGQYAVSCEPSGAGARVYPQNYCAEHGLRHSEPAKLAA